mmetsp:Transcript_28800/g.50661  ORF Transcript_28800/g.50661 Transcript_28800/m.50661 type:complete len:236 (+) Transcript_28800:424-1131(+)
MMGLTTFGPTSTASTPFANLEDSEQSPPSHVGAAEGPSVGSAVGLGPLGPLILLRRAFTTAVAVWFTRSFRLIGFFATQTGHPQGTGAILAGLIVGLAQVVAGQPAQIGVSSLEVVLVTLRLGVCCMAFSAWSSLSDAFFISLSARSDTEGDVALKTWRLERITFVVGNKLGIRTVVLLEFPGKGDMVGATVVLCSFCAAASTSAMVSGRVTPGISTASGFEAPRGDAVPVVADV